MRNKTLVKSEKVRPEKEKRTKRGWTLSSAKASFSGNSHVGRKKMPKIFVGSSSTANTISKNYFIYSKSIFNFRL